MSIITIRRLPLVAAVAMLHLALVGATVAQEDGTSNNADVLQRRRQLIQEYKGATSQAERSRIIDELSELRAKEAEPAETAQTDKAAELYSEDSTQSGGSAPGTTQTGSASPTGQSPDFLPFPFQGFPSVSNAPGSSGGGTATVGLGTKANDPSAFGFKKFSASTKVAEKKGTSFFGTDEEGNNRFERSGGRVISRDGIEAPPETPAATDEEKSRARRLAESTEIGVTFLEKKVGGELKKFETESGSAFKKRKDLAKGRAGVRFGAGNASVTGDAKFNPGKLDVGAGFTGKASVAAVEAKAEGQLGNDKLAAKGSASGSVLKASAKLDTRIGVTKEFIGAKVEAGAGASVAEGSLSGSIGSKWLGLEVGGTVSGSVLTAEARANASAGFNRKTERFEIEVGGKIGALLAGAGANIKISLNKPGWWPW